eukprot:221248-Prorocentrum_minimum.AAC.2
MLSGFAEFPSFGALEVRSVVLLPFSCGPWFPYYQSHSSCVTEHEKYVLTATKPGGKAAGGHESQHVGSSASNGAGQEPVAPPVRPAWKPPSQPCSPLHQSVPSHESARKPSNKPTSSHPQLAQLVFRPLPVIFMQPPSRSNAPSAHVTLRRATGSWRSGRR